MGCVAPHDCFIYKQAGATHLTGGAGVRTLAEAQAAGVAAILGATGGNTVRLQTLRMRLSVGSAAVCDRSLCRHIDPGATLAPIRRSLKLHPYSAELDAVNDGPAASEAAGNTSLLEHNMAISLSADSSLFAVMIVVEFSCRFHTYLQDLAKYYMALEKGLFVDLAAQTATAINGLQPKINVWNTGAQGGASLGTLMFSLPRSCTP